MNQQAGLVIAESDGLKIVAQSLCATHFASRKNLRRAMDVVKAIPGNCEDRDAEIVSVVRYAGRRNLELFVTPLCQPLPAALAQNMPAFAVLIWDPEKSAPIHLDRIRHVYQLTVAEAKITVGLARGMAVDELAQQMRVQTNTIRIHLKRIYHKTGARRQTDLVRLVATNFLLNLP
jgi:DNA-binding CsgD family transcriptional regulator